jgi:hypothetical protein
VTLSAALAGATTPTAETATNMLGGGAIDEKDNAGWYALVGGSFFPVVSYKKKDDTSSTIHVLTVWNVHARVVPANTAITLYRFTAFCEVVSSKAIVIKAGGDMKRWCITSSVTRPCAELTWPAGFSEPSSCARMVGLSP